MSYKTELFDKKDFYDRNAFLLCSMDISGIQSFIYTISSKKCIENFCVQRSFLPGNYDGAYHRSSFRTDCNCQGQIFYTPEADIVICFLQNTTETVIQIQKFQED